MGILFKSAEALEKSAQTWAPWCSDKTGTVTRGKPAVTDNCGCRARRRLARH